MVANTEPPRSLRLTLVTETFPPEVNGVARTLHRWVEAFRGRGHYVQVIRPRQFSEGPLPERVLGLPVPFYPQMRFGVASPVRLRTILERSSPDLVHIATEGPLGWAALMAAGFLGLPVVSSFHTNYDHYLNHYGLGGLEMPLLAYLRWFHNQTALTLAPSRAAQQRLLAEGLQRVEIWSRGVDGRTFHPRHRDSAFRSSLGLSANDPLILYVGRLAAEKNLSALLAAFTRLRQRLPSPLDEKVRLAVVGDGPLFDSLRTMQSAAVLFPGARHGDDLSRWYASADLFAFPSQSETFGNVVLEAQASGLPVVGYDCQGVNERVTHGADGLLTPKDGDLTENLETLCRDGALRQRLATAARHTAERQDWKPILDGLEQRYLQLARKRQPLSDDAAPRRPLASGGRWVAPRRTAALS